MSFSKFERVLLANQYRILAAVDPKNASYHNRRCKIVEDGYELHYSEILNVGDPLPQEDCSYVLRAIGLFSGMQFSYGKLTDKTGIDPNRLKFPGFDEDTESYFLAYARFAIDELHGFPGLLYQEDLITFTPMTAIYNRMLAVSKEVQLGEYGCFTKEAINQIIAAGEENI